MIGAASRPLRTPAGRDGVLADLGCIPQPTYIWARHQHPMLNQLVQPLLRLVEAEEAPEFTPFKAAPEK